MRLKNSEMTPLQKMGRNSKRRGADGEKALVKLLTKFNVPCKRVAASGALKENASFYVGKKENYQSDVQIIGTKTTIRVEVKTRKVLPAYVTKGNVPLVEGYCYLMNLDKFLKLLSTANYSYEKTTSKIITTARTKEVVRWFKQDEADIVAMRETGKRTWYFAVRLNSLNKIKKFIKELEVSNDKKEGQESGRG